MSSQGRGVIGTLGGNDPSSPRPSCRYCFKPKAGDPSGKYPCLRHPDARPTSPPASPRCEVGYCDVPEHWDWDVHISPRPTSPPAEPTRHSVFEPRDMKATIERGEWTPPAPAPVEGEG